MRPAAMLVTALVIAVPLTRAHAGPPPDLPPAIQDHAQPQLEADQRGFWLSVELIGPRGAQLDAAHSLAQPPVRDALPRVGAPPPGELVGRVDTLEQALVWVHHNSFAVLTEGKDATAIPGGRLYEDHGLFLTALILTQDAMVAPQPYPWPPADVLALPPGVDWRPATLAVARAPLFAAPSPTVPPASERYRVVTLGDSLWQLDANDRCEGPAEAPGPCLRWARILVRRGDRFFGGWVLAAHVIPDSAWVGGPGERRFALRPGHRDHAEVGFVLHEQRNERREPPIGLVQAHAGTTWPDADVRIFGEELAVMIGQRSVLTRHISDEPLPLTKEGSLR